MRVWLSLWLLIGAPGVLGSEEWVLVDHSAQAWGLEPPPALQGPREVFHGETWEIRVDFRARTREELKGLLTQAPGTLVLKPWVQRRLSRLPWNQAFEKDPFPPGLRQEFKRNLEAWTPRTPGPPQTHWGQYQKTRGPGSEVEFRGVLVFTWKTSDLVREVQELWLRCEAQAQTGNQGPIWLEDLKRCFTETL